MEMPIVKRLLQQKTIPKTFEVFRVDGIPLWYFLEPLAPAWYLPKPHKSWREIERDIKNNRLPSSLAKLKFDLSAFAVMKGLIVSEKIKLLISKFDKKGLRGVGKKEVLFIVPTDEIFEEKGKLKFSVINGIINALEKKKIKLLVLVHDPLSTLPSFKMKEYGPLLYTYITLEVLKESKRVSNELNKKWKALDEELKIKLFTYKGKSYWKFFEKNMDFLFSKELLFTLITYYLTFKKILEDHDVKVIYLTSIMGIKELSLLGAAYKLKRKIVYTQPGYFKIPRTLKATLKKEFLKNVLFTAEGEERKRRLLKDGAKEEQIFVTGSPFYDEILNYKQEKPGEGKKVIALLTTSLVKSRHMEEKKYFELIHKVLNQIGQVEEAEKIIIKLHPNEKHMSRYESIAKSLNLKNFEIVQEPGKAALYSVMSRSDLLVGFGSTALLEGLMLDKDVIHLDEFVKGLVEFEFIKATLHAKKLDNLTKLIRRVLRDKKLKEKLKKKRRKYLRESFYKVDGKAHERVADLIEKVTTMSKRKI